MKELFALVPNDLTIIGVGGCWVLLVRYQLLKIISTGFWGLRKKIPAGIRKVCNHSHLLENKSRCC